MRMVDTFKRFVYICVGILFIILVLTTLANVIAPLMISCQTGNFMWLLLYIAEPFLLFGCIYVWLLLEDMEWWF